MQYLLINLIDKTDLRCGNYQLHNVISKLQT